MRILVVSVQTPFVRGGAEVLADELVKALIRAGHHAELAAIPFNSTNPERIPEAEFSVRSASRVG
ncbi:MAG TPA: hypothetical protein VJ719_06125 [Chthoniobacterales bacterium]|nr:hypothetical protein [Chthoniobacterales bacterium]